MTSFWAGLGRARQNNTNENNLKKFFNDNLKVINQFKALYAYGGSVSQQERKSFHSKNYRRVFAVCRNALDEYAKKAAVSTRRGDNDDAKAPCEIIEALSRLCTDIPDIIKRNWNHNALSELLTKFLNFNTNEKIRLKGVGKDGSYHRYIEMLQFTADFTPYCIEKPYENHYNNFKKNLIVGMSYLCLKSGSNNIHKMLYANSCGSLAMG